MNTIKKILFFFNFASKIKTSLFGLSSFILSILEIIGISMLIPLLALFFQTDQVISNNELKNISLFISKNFSENIIILIIFLIFLFKSFFYIFLINWKLKFVNQISILISKNLLKKYMNGDQEYFNKKNSGELLRNVTHENRKIIKSLSASADLLIDLTLLTVAITFLIFVNFRITLTIFIFFLLFILIYFLFIKNLLYKLANKNIFLTSDALKFLIECFKGYSEIFINKKQTFFINRYIDKDQLILKYTRYQGVINVLPRTLLELTIIIIALYFLISFSNIKDNINLIFFNLTIFGTVFFRLYPSIGKSISNLQTIISAKPSLNLLFDEINRNLKIDDRKKIFLEKSYSVESIIFKNIDFYYNRNTLILKNINKVIKKNSIIGITGESGTGKTTLIHLLSGILVPTQGNILIDSYKLEDIKNWTDKIAYVSQKPFIMDSSIRDNVCFGDRLDKIDETRLNEIYSLAGLEDFINNLNQRDLTRIGESGNFASGGQIQRIGIARALYKKAQVILLDEITSNLDDKIKNKILKNLIDLKKDRIIFLISHDKKILDYCDDYINL